MQGSREMPLYLDGFIGGAAGDTPKIKDIYRVWQDSAILRRILMSA